MPCDYALPQHESKTENHSQGEQVGTFYSIAHTGREHEAARTQKRDTDSYDSRINRIAPYPSIDELAQSYGSKGSEHHSPEGRTYGQTESHYKCRDYGCTVCKRTGTAHQIACDEPLCQQARSQTVAAQIYGVETVAEHSHQQGWHKGEDYAVSIALDAVATMYVGRERHLEF